MQKQANRRTPARKRRRKGGMVRAAKPVRKMVTALGESLGKDYLQNKTPKVLKGIHEDPSLAKSPRFVLTAKKPFSTQKTAFRFDLDENKENVKEKKGSKNTIGKRSTLATFKKGLRKLTYLR